MFVVIPHQEPTYKCSSTSHDVVHTVLSLVDDDDDSLFVLFATVCKKPAHHNPIIQEFIFKGCHQQANDFFVCVCGSFCQFSSSMRHFENISFAK